jgi:hypothetical protein
LIGIEDFDVFQYIISLQLHHGVEERKEDDFLVLITENLPESDAMLFFTSANFI